MRAESGVEVAIVGAGPAGMAAALQLKRSGIEPLLLERERVGGLLLNANLVENYPGFPQGISGIKLAQLFEAQLARWGVEPQFEEVLQLDHDGDAFRLETDKRRITAGIVILASGTKPKGFTDCAISQEAMERIFYEVYPLRGVEKTKIAIVGGGDAAFDYALNLARRNDVHLLHRSSQTKCLPLLWERAQAAPRVSYHANTVITAIERSGTGLLLRLVTSRESWTLRADYAIFAVGRVPQLDFLAPGLRERLEQLQARGLLHLVGDVHRGIYRQTAIAVGDGLQAAMKVYHQLKEG